MSGLYGLPVHPLDYTGWMPVVCWYFTLGYREWAGERYEFGYEPVIYWGA